jgi:hypothetical protein
MLADIDGSPQREGPRFSDFVSSVFRDTLGFVWQVAARLFDSSQDADRSNMDAGCLVYAGGLVFVFLIACCAGGLSAPFVFLVSAYGQYTHLANRTSLNMGSTEYADFVFPEALDQAVKQIESPGFPKLYSGFPEKVAGLGSRTETADWYHSSRKFFDAHPVTMGFRYCNADDNVNRSILLAEHIASVNSYEDDGDQASSPVFLLLFPLLLVTIYACGIRMWTFVIAGAFVAPFSRRKLGALMRASHRERLNWKRVLLLFLVVPIVEGTIAFSVFKPAVPPMSQAAIVMLEPNLEMSLFAASAGVVSIMFAILFFQVFEVATVCGFTVLGCQRISFLPRLVSLAVPIVILASSEIGWIQILVSTTVSASHAVTVRNIAV